MKVRALSSVYSWVELPVGCGEMVLKRHLLGAYHVPNTMVGTEYRRSVKQLRVLPRDNGTH